MSLSDLVDNVEDVIFKERDENNDYDDLIYAVIEELHQRYGYAKAPNN